MSRNQGAIFSDTSHNGGLIFWSAMDIAAFAAAAPVLTRNGANDVSFNRTAAGAETIQFVKGLDCVRRLIESYQAEGAFQEQFNLANPTIGRQPLSGATNPQFVTPTTAGPGKGFQVDDIFIVYRVGVVGLTSLALSFAEIKFGENLAQAPIAIATTGVPLLTTQANNHVATFKVTVPIFITDDTSDLQAEFAIVMANTGTLRVYGIGMHGHFNYN